MMLRTTLTTLGILLVLVLGTTIDDNGADDMDQAQQSLEDAQRSATEQAQLQRQFDGVVQKLCGENAGWMYAEDGAIQCTAKPGTLTAQVRP